MGRSMQQFLDKVTLVGVTETGDGYLVADAFTVRTGIQRYLGSEVGKPELPFVDVYRPEDEVFNADALRSFAHVPVTDDHPREPVTKDNWKQLAVGEASTEVLRDGHRMKIPLIVKDGAAIKKIRSGKRELSAGYACDLSFEDGTTPEGLPYQAVQRNIRANHIAIVDRGRAGPDFRIGDSASAWGAAPITTDKEAPTMNLQKITVDGLTVEVTDQGAQVIQKLQQQLSDSGAKLISLTNDHNTVVTAKDTRIGELTAQLADAQKKALDGPALDAAVAARTALIDTARKIAKDVKVEGLSDADIRRAVVSAKYGEAMVKDSSDDVIAGMFKAAVADAGSGANDTVRSAMLSHDSQPGRAAPPADRGIGAYHQRLTDAWKGEQAKA